jgi:hypothetical protein
MAERWSAVDELEARGLNCRSHDFCRRHTTNCNMTA